MNLSYTPVLIGLALLLSISEVRSQTPERINYQAVARDSESGQELSNQQVFVLIRILQGGPNGILAYEESHSGIQTNEFGLLNLQIGGGDVSEGSFSDIPWAEGNVWMTLEIDAGEGLQNMGAMQFVSVPYALYAENAGNTDDEDTDPTNELINSATYNAEENQIEIQESDNPPVIIPLEAFNTDDDDSDPTNELIVSGTYDPELNSINLEQADGSTVEIALDALVVDDGDSDPENELIDPDQGLQLIGNTTLQITEAGIAYSVNLDALIEDDDPDPENELIEDGTFVLTNDTILSITEAGEVHEVNLSALQDDDDWNISTDGESLFTSERKVGVGVTSPSAKLEIVEENENTAAIKVGNGENALIYGKNQQLGFHTEAPNSSTEFSKSVGYDFTLVTNESNTGYIASENDNIIIVRLVATGESIYTVVLPPADECEGRMYTIRKTGASPGFGEVLIDTGEFPVDFLSPDIELDEPNAETAVRLFLGSDGWTRILREN